MLHRLFHVVFSYKLCCLGLPLPVFHKGPEQSSSHVELQDCNCHAGTWLLVTLLLLWFSKVFARLWGNWVPAFNPPFEKGWNLRVSRVGECPDSGHCTALDGITPPLYAEPISLGGWGWFLRLRPCSPCYLGAEACHCGGSTEFSFFLAQRTLPTFYPMTD